MSKPKDVFQDRVILTLFDNESGLVIMAEVNSKFIKKDGGGVSKPAPQYFVNLEMFMKRLAVVSKKRQFEKNPKVHSIEDIMDHISERAAKRQWKERYGDTF
jgi:hypothetical protein